VSTPLRWRARCVVCEQAGKEREHQRAAIVNEREPTSPMMASTATDEGKPLQLLIPQAYT
jgi:hypothetical protein